MRLFAAALGLLAVHVVVDAFAAPQAGTGLRDNLAPGLVPLLVIAAALLAYPRLRPGGRAAVAALFAALAAEGAVLAALDAARTFSRPSDWTGFLLAPAGGALLALALVTLYRARRPGLRHKLVLVAATALGVYWVALPLAAAIYATHRPRAGVAPSPATIRRADGLRLAASYTPSKNGAAVIVFPTRTGRGEHARMLVRHGYGVLALDMHGYEGSEGAPNAFGWGASQDIEAAVAWLRARGVTRIGGIGFSVGGEQMLDAAAAGSSLRAVVSEGAGERSVRETVGRGWRAALAVPAAAVETAAVAALSQEGPPPSLRTVAARVAPRAAFFVYAEHGAGGEDLNPAYFAAARAPKEIWRVPGAGHTGGLDARPREYERRVSAFFDRYLLGRGNVADEAAAHSPATGAP